MGNKFILLILTLSFIYNQTVKVIVLDDINSSPLKNANVIIKLNDMTEFGKSTDENGECSFNSLLAGFYSLEVTYIGYSDYSTRIAIDLMNPVTIECSMNIQSILVPELKIISDLNAPYRKIPGAASVIDLRTINDISPIGTQEILEHVPGIHSFADDGIGNSRISIGIRGLNPRRSSRVLILEDGIPIQPALYVYPNMYYNPPVERLDGIQVIKGSGSIKYGPQTMGGVINYYTRRPENNFSTNLKLTAGENGYASTFAEINGFGSINTKNAIQILYKRGDGFRQNNEFEQYNLTLKTSFNHFENKNYYLKIGSNYENSNATYTGLTQYSFDNNPQFNPKEDDNFKIKRLAVDLIETHKINDKLKSTRKIYGSYFDRRWWREDDIFISESDPTKRGLYPDVGTDLYFVDDLIRVGNEETNFGILRTFYVLGVEQSLSLNHTLFNKKNVTEFGLRGYWERFIDNRKVGYSPDDRIGKYYWDPEEGDEVYDLNQNGIYDENYSNPEFPTDLGIGDYCVEGADGECNYIDVNGDGIYNLVETRVGQSQHYETKAFSAYITNNISIGTSLFSSGLRIELFEQERIDLLDGATYLDNFSYVLLPSIGFIQNFNNFSVFGGIHRGYTPPSSGALKVTNFVLDAGLDLKAEKSWNKEIGIRTFDLYDIIDLEFSLFHVDVENLVAAGRGAVFKNLGKITTMGSETNLTFSLANLPTVQLVHTFLKTNVLDAEINVYPFMEASLKDIKGNQLPYAPEQTFTISTYKIFYEKLKVRADLKYVSTVFTDFHNLTSQQLLDEGITGEKYILTGIAGSVPDYHVINMSLIYSLTNKLELSLITKNLTDKIYIGSRLHSNPAQKLSNQSSGIMPGPRRQINFSVKYSL